MALFSRIFNLTRAALLQILWFSRLYEWVILYRNRIHTFLENSPAYQRAKQTLATIKLMLKGRGRLLRILRRIRRNKLTSNQQS
jgi:hypothetical protein